MNIRREKAKDTETAELRTTATGLGHRTLLTATMTAFVDMRNDAPSLLPVDDRVRLDGQTALVMRERARGDTVKVLEPSAKIPTSLERPRSANPVVSCSRDSTIHGSLARN